MTFLYYRLSSTPTTSLLHRLQVSSTTKENLYPILFYDNLEIEYRLPNNNLITDLIIEARFRAILTILSPNRVNYTIKE